MNIKNFMKIDNEKPLDNFVINGGLCSIFKTIGCIGDSLSSGALVTFENNKPGYIQDFNYSWGQFMASDTGAKVYNFSECGLNAYEYIGFAQKNGYFAKELACQAYIIALGVNDIGGIVKGNGEFGDITDINLSDSADNKPTFSGHIGGIISRYKEIEHDAKFFLVTMPKSKVDDEINGYYDMHQKLMHQIAEIFNNCYVVDLRKYAPFYDDEFKRNFYLEDHMNASGYRVTALMIESYIDYIIRNNPEDFITAGLIGSGYHNTHYKR